jgi:uncharacterized protein (UPF0248 family)
MSEQAVATPVKTYTLHIHTTSRAILQFRGVTQRQIDLATATKIFYLDDTIIPFHGIVWITLTEENTSDE